MRDDPLTPEERAQVTEAWKEHRLQRLKATSVSQRKLHLSAMDMPQDLWFAEWERIPGPETNVICRNYTKRSKEMLRKGVSVLFCGSEGVGKSGAAAWLATEITRRGYLGGFWVTPWAYRTATRESNIRQRCKDARILVLDDLTEEDIKDRFCGLQEFVSLAKYRAGKARPTYITSRLDLELEDFESVPNMVVVDMEGEDQRIALKDSLL